MHNVCESGFIDMLILHDYISASGIAWIPCSNGLYCS